MAKRLREKYKRAFFAGLATILPTVLTIFVIFFCYRFITDNIAAPLNGLIRTALATEPAKDWYWEGLLRYPGYQLDEFLDQNEKDDTLVFSDRVAAHVPGWLGFVLALVLVFIVGFLFKGYIGRQILRALERWVLRLPVVKIIYPYAKQITEFFFEGRRPIQYESAVAVQYPRKGIWSVGFVTSEGFRDIQEAAQKEVVAIFIPSSPTPVTGYTILVPKEDVITLNLTVDEALRFTISAGVLLPPAQLPPIALKTRKLEKPTPTS